MKLTVSLHAIYRYKTRIRDCQTRLAIEQIEAAYATGRTAHMLPGGHRFVDNGSMRLVISPKNVVMSVYLKNHHCPGFDAAEVGHLPGRAI